MLRKIKLTPESDVALNSARRVGANRKMFSQSPFIYTAIVPAAKGAMQMKRVAIYLRVSTSKQDTANQLRELKTVAKRSGWKIVATYEDAGISGAKGRDQRPGLDAMLKAGQRQRVRSGGGLVCGSARSFAD